MNKKKGTRSLRYISRYHNICTHTYVHILHIFIHTHTPHTHLQVGEKGYEFFKVDFTASVDVDFIKGGFSVFKWFMVDGTRGGKEERTREEEDVEWALHWLVY